MDLTPAQERCYVALRQALDNHVTNHGLTFEGLSIVMATLTGELVAQLHRNNPNAPHLLQMVSRVLWQCCREGARIPLLDLASAAPASTERLRLLAQDLLRLLAEYTTEARLNPWHVLVVLMQVHADVWAPVASGDESILEHADGLWQNYLRKTYPTLRL